MTGRSKNRTTNHFGWQTAALPLSHCHLMQCWSFLCSMWKMLLANRLYIFTSDSLCCSDALIKENISYVKPCHKSLYNLKYRCEALFVCHLCWLIRCQPYPYIQIVSRNGKLCVCKMFQNVYNLLLQM